MNDKVPEEKGGLDAGVLEASFAVIAPDANLLVARFYEELFDRFPAVQPMFAESDMVSQQAKLLAALKLVIANVRKPDALIPALQEMGRRHEQYGALPDHYVAVASVLISVMAEIAGEKWTDQIQVAWSDALTVVAEVMIGAYGDADRDERRSADRPWSQTGNSANAVDDSVAETLPKIARPS